MTPKVHLRLRGLRTQGGQSGAKEERKRWRWGRERVKMEAFQKCDLPCSCYLSFSNTFCLTEGVIHCFDDSTFYPLRLKDRFKSAHSFLYLRAVVKNCKRKSSLYSWPCLCTNSSHLGEISCHSQGVLGNVWWHFWLSQWCSGGC